MNSLTLAYLGDAIYEVFIRKHLIEKGIIKVNSLQKEATRYVSAKGQATMVTYLLDGDVFNIEEKQIFLTARNHKSHAHPKNTDILTYKHATGFEAVIGYLYLYNQTRLQEVLQSILEHLQEGG